MKIRDQIKKTCLKYGYSIPLKKGNLLYDEHHNLSLCINAKVQKPEYSINLIILVTYLGGQYDNV